ncbi:MAG: hypothetical protein OXU26_00315, partial [Acidobacteriota bacterium]|nr:hypothetical protein [Acidobacteriota bacterium]
LDGPFHRSFANSGEKFGLKESYEAAVDVGRPRKRCLQAIIIEQRSCGSGSPAGKAKRNPREVPFGSNGSLF